MGFKDWFKRKYYCLDCRKEILDGNQYWCKACLKLKREQHEASQKAFYDWVELKDTILESKIEKEARDRDEALWTEYAKAALKSFIITNADKLEDVPEKATAMADFMLFAHKKRWP